MKGQAFQKAITHMLDGFAYCRGVYDDTGAMIDWVYELVNVSFEALTGLHDAVGKKATDIIPGIRQTNPEVFEIYGRVSRGAPAETFETFVPGLKIWFHVSVYSIEKGTFIAIFDNITAAKNSIAKLHSAIEELDTTYAATIKAWGVALEMKDPGTQGHTVRVASHAIIVATRNKMNTTVMKNVYFGSLLHDIGKIGIPDSILLKPGKLSYKEMEIMKQHPIFGYNFIVGVPFLHGAANVPYCHHEHWDGSGYPRGLQGEEIPICARIFALVDVYDALTHDRPYRRAISHRMAIGVMKEMRSQFDPTLFADFMDVEGDPEYHAFLSSK